MIDPIPRDSLRLAPSKSILNLDQIYLSNPDLELMDFILLRTCNPNISSGALGGKCNKVYRMLGIQMGKFLTP